MYFIWGEWGDSITYSEDSKVSLSRACIKSSMKVNTLDVYQKFRSMI
jgi:hypothetical protein